MTDSALDGSDRDDTDKFGDELESLSLESVEESSVRLESDGDGPVSPSGVKLVGCKDFTGGSTDLVATVVGDLANLKRTGCERSAPEGTDARAKSRRHTNVQAELALAPIPKWTDQRRGHLE